DAPRPNPDHQYRAVRSALEMQDAIASIAGEEPGAPRFRIGVNTGVALVGNIGSAELRSFNLVGDAVNVASRLETSADPGTVVIGETTYRAIEGRAEVVSLGPLELKGRDLPVNAYRLERLYENSG
ncbi:MAG: adenylate/guanylate cyclase domain-containing protein, partial [Actinomycetota bacterium]